MVRFSIYVTRRCIVVFSLLLIRDRTYFFTQKNASSSFLSFFETPAESFYVKDMLNDGPKILYLKAFFDKCERGQSDFHAILLECMYLCTYASFHSAAS
jgi:hypothetical protein